MKQIINSGWKEFDRQTNCITTGNAICSTQESNYIRAYNDTECNGFQFEPGHLLKADLKGFSNQRIPKAILEVLNDHERKESVILYMFFIHDKHGHQEPFCWAITTKYPEHKLVKYNIVYGYRQNYWKRYNAAQEAISYITDTL